MNCPKCGFAQEERADCRKCGVVFAKFVALRSQDSPVPTDHPQFHAPPTLSEELQSTETSLLQEVRQSLKTLQQRFHELEFERAERRRIRDELRALDMRMKESLAQMTAQQEALMQQAAKLTEHPPAPTIQDFAALKMEVRSIDGSSVYPRMERIEARMQTLSQELAAKADLRFLEVLPGMEERLREAEGRIESLTEDHGTALEEDALVRLDSALHSFEDLKTSLQNVTLRYSEIGELKKNHLVLRDMVESLQVASEAYKRDSVSGNAGRLLELEKEVSALKAELRNAYEHLELLEARSSQAAPAPELPPIKEIETLRGELAALENVRTEDRQRWQAMEDKLADMSVRPHNGSDHPVSTDMYDIRKNLDEIRGFMAHLSRKL